MKFWITNAGVQGLRLSVRRRPGRFSVRFLGICVSLKWGEKG